MSTDIILARLAALEEQIGEFLPAALERKRSVFEPGDWLMAKVRAKVEIDRCQANMSIADTADIFIDGDIDDRMALAVHDQLEAARLSPKIRVHIDTQGGDYAAAVRIYRNIRWHTGATEAKLGKRCQSAGVLVAMSCDHRVATQGTEFWMHLTASQPDPRERWTLYRHCEAMRYLRTLDNEMLNIIADRTGADLTALAIEAARDEQQSLQWCLDHGLIHAVEESSK